jgi:hypothetical protein
VDCLAGHQVLLQAWDFRPSDNFVVQMRRPRAS